MLLEILRVHICVNWRPVSQITSILHSVYDVKLLHQGVEYYLLRFKVAVSVYLQSALLNLLSIIAPNGLELHCGSFELLQYVLYEGGLSCVLRSNNAYRQFSIHVRFHSSPVSVPNICQGTCRISSSSSPPARPCGGCRTPSSTFSSGKSCRTLSRGLPDTMMA